MGIPTNTNSQGLSTTMKTSFLAIALVALLASSALARQSLKNGYRITFDVPKGTWEYVDFPLEMADFLAPNGTDTSDYKVQITTDVTEVMTTKLWFDTTDIDQEDAADEIDPDASVDGRGDRSGLGDAPGAGDYILSIFADCDGCNDITIELSMYLTDGTDPADEYQVPVPFKLQNNMVSAEFEVPEGEIQTLSWHNDTAGDEIYINVLVSNPLNTVNVKYGTDMPLVTGDETYPSGSAIKGDFKTGALETMPGMNYYGIEGVEAVADGVNFEIATGINAEPTVAGSFTFPSVIAVAIAAVAAIFAL